ncbi:GIY-YIG nuclease family protein [Bizionia myxarmorum]|uniref:GIY-YIG nuclease family protein n=1 Tax=Bizionia myxarmorum TaxID=291186 RepID=A0A5D0R5Y8_9FLAO|nr:GIY-YIG nuclease family protein [Bizionia myxarmorum]
MSSYLYILYSKIIDRYYIGHTSGAIEERLRKHNTNHKGYTGHSNDSIIVYSETFTNKLEAYARERTIKKQKSTIYIENLISTTKKSIPQIGTVTVSNPARLS